MGYSRKDDWDDKKVNHYDDNGNLIGYSRKDDWDDKKINNYDKYGNQKGYSRKDDWDSKKRNNYNKYGENKGYSRKDDWDSKKTNHYDKYGDKKSYSRKDDWDNKKTNHYKNNEGCFLTTACVEYKGLPDDCYELNILRNFRDDYMMNFEEGKNDIQTYYDIAPNIVKRINELDNKGEIYNFIYEDLIIECIRLINKNRMKEAYENYKNFVKQLYNKYCVNI